LELSWLERSPLALSRLELWQLDLLTEPAPDRLAWLSDAERARAARFVFERDRRRFLAAHCGLRALLAARTGIAAAALVFREGAHGKPSLTHAGACSFNMSHSEDIALVAIADASAGEIGVDVEMLRDMPDATDLARHNFSASECDELAAAAPEHRSLAFLRGWTRKEACLKAIGSGLSIAPNLFTAGLDDVARSVRIATPSGAADVRVHSFRHGPDIVGSLAHLEADRG
jgi:4'-phosphopantetheinyl transferase